MQSVQSQTLKQETSESKKNEEMLTVQTCCFKRSSDLSEQSQKYNTQRKYDQTNSFLFDPDVTAKFNKKDCQQKISFVDKDLSATNNSLQFYVHSVLMKESQCHQLPVVKDLDQKRKTQIEGKLDQIVLLMRSKIKEGRVSVLSIIKQLKLTNQTFGFDNLRKILELRKDFYDILEVTDEKHKIIDILVSFPHGEDSRQKELRRQILAFSKTSSQNLKDQQRKIENTKQKTKTNIQMNKSKKGAFVRTDHFEALKTGNRQKFQQQLKQKIKQKEQKSKLQRQKRQNMGHESGQLLIVFDEIMSIFRRRDKTSIFKQLLIQDLNKSLNIRDGAISKIFQVLAHKFSAFFKVIPHKSGDIYQIQKKLYNQIRAQIQAQPTVQL